MPELLNRTPLLNNSLLPPSLFQITQCLRTSRTPPIKINADDDLFIHQVRKLHEYAKRRTKNSKNHCTKSWYTPSPHPSHHEKSRDFSLAPVCMLTTSNRYPCPPSAFFFFFNLADDFLTSFLPLPPTS
ncbi:hypothetical protein CDAR_420291 [Caerostris darwini]|uniref:Uncharacterized protein n=1 Tax=Caerostris darwini TaxID=1538125 RepID=A0AAV4TWF4_9ARAC|nr:hypothetical protein CDAR_420291 [Caerostris darwini]